MPKHRNSRQHQTKRRRRRQKQYDCFLYAFTFVLVFVSIFRSFLVPALQLSLNVSIAGITTTASKSKNSTSNSTMTSPTTSSTSSTSKSVPIVIISSLRPQYLAQVLESIQVRHQNPNTPHWILHSPRYVLVHKHSFDSTAGHKWIETQQVVKDHCQQTHNNCLIHVFEGTFTGRFPPTNPIQAYYTKHVWYREMRFLFHTLKKKKHQQFEDVLILEDDAVLAPDALMVAARLLQEKELRSDIHTIALGGRAGKNKINAHPDTYLALRSKYFPAMAYSMNATLFDQIETAFLLAEANLSKVPQDVIDRKENHVESADWTMEITSKNLVPNLTVLQPTVGRMHHIGVEGLGDNGNGQTRISFPIPWAFCNDTITDTSRSLEKKLSFRLDPPQITDREGFVCNPPEPICPGVHYMEEHKGFGPNKVPYRTREELRTWRRQEREKKRNRDKKGSSSSPIIDHQREAHVRRIRNDVVRDRPPPRDNYPLRDHPPPERSPREYGQEHPRRDLAPPPHLESALIQSNP